MGRAGRDDGEDVAVLRRDADRRRLKPILGFWLEQKIDAGGYAPVLAELRRYRSLAASEPMLVGVCRKLADHLLDEPSAQPREANFTLLCRRFPPVEPLLACLDGAPLPQIHLYRQSGETTACGRVIGGAWKEGLARASFESRSKLWQRCRECAAAAGPDQPPLRGDEQERLRDQARAVLEQTILDSLDDEDLGWRDLTSFAEEELVRQQRTWLAAQLTGAGAWVVERLAADYPEIPLAAAAAVHLRFDDWLSLIEQWDEGLDDEALAHRLGALLHAVRLAA